MGSQKELILESWLFFLSFSMRNPTNKKENKIFIHLFNKFFLGSNLIKYKSVTTVVPGHGKSMKNLLFFPYR